MKTALVASLLLCLQLPLPAYAVDDKISGLAFNSMCQAPPGSFDKALCDGFLTGFLDGFRTAPILTDAFNVCLPDTLDAVTAAAALNRILRSDPKLNDDATATAVMMALLARFPCKL